MFGLGVVGYLFYTSAGPKKKPDSGGKDEGGIELGLTNYGNPVRAFWPQLLLPLTTVHCFLFVPACSRGLNRRTHLYATRSRRFYHALHLLSCPHVSLVFYPLCQLQDGSRQMARLVENEHRSITEGKSSMSAFADKGESENRRGSTNSKRGSATSGIFKKLSFFSEV
jgi:hypothetical protein